MKFLAALLVATLAIVSCEVTQMLELTPALYAPSLEVGTVCDDCKEAIQFILTNNKTMIGLVCDLVPSLLRPECSKILNEVIKGATAQKVCADVKLCSSAGVAGSVLRDFKCTQLISKISDEDNCQICKDIVGCAFSDIPALKALLKEVCSKTGALANECNIAVDIFFEEANQYNATFVCQELKVCNKTSPQLLGADLCTRGPGYWCASLDNANECGAFEFCEKKYWV